MHIKKVKKGDEVAMPLVAFGKGGGVTFMESPIDGILVKITPEECHAGLTFVPSDILNEAGYFASKLEPEKNTEEVEEVEEVNNEEG